LVVVAFFLRHSLVSTAFSFRQDFERQSFLELSRGDTFLLARKLAALAKSEQLTCVRATKQGILFFEEAKGRCQPGIFRVVEKVREPNQQIDVTFALGLQSSLFSGFLLFIVLQLALMGAIVWAQRTAVKIAYQHDLDLAAQARQVGHDIRSPLAVLEHAGEAGAVRERALSRLKELVGRLLGESTGRRGSIPLSQLVQEAIEEKRAEFGSKVALSFQCLDESILAPGDPFLWRRILSNLMNNAVEAATGRAEVEIRQVREDDLAVIEIKDRGRGIPVSILAKLGERGATFGKKRGRGFGLWSAREFLKSLGGGVEIKSREGKGTVARLQFPILREASVLIDDDLALAEVWRRVAEKRGIGFQHFASPEDFLSAGTQVPRTASIYLDVEFPESRIRLDRFGQDLKKSGFRRIYLATGHPKDKFRQWKWVTEVVGKEPPWI
jgi:signal transduction histidine kinase